YRTQTGEGWPTHLIIGFDFFLTFLYSWLACHPTGEVSSFRRTEMGRGKALFAMAAAVLMWAAVQPGTAFAQTSGIGNDGYTRFSWRGTDNRISLWQLYPTTLDQYNSKQYGP